MPPYRGVVKGKNASCVKGFQTGLDRRGLDGDEAEAEGKELEGDDVLDEEAVVVAEDAARRFLTVGTRRFLLFAFACSAASS